MRALMFDWIGESVRLGDECAFEYFDDDFDDDNGYCEYTARWEALSK